MDYSSLQGLCSHVELSHVPLSSAPEEALQALHRWTCCNVLIPLGKACRICQQQGPRQKRPPAPQSGGSPAVKARGVEGEVQLEPLQPRAAVPPGLSCSKLPHHCPFPQCAQSRGRGAGWLTPRELFLHVNSVHLSCKQLPGSGFLGHYRRAVCTHCAVLIAAGRPCPACLNREQKTVHRRVQQARPSPPSSSHLPRRASGRHWSL